MLQRIRHVLQLTYRRRYNVGAGAGRFVPIPVPYPFQIRTTQIYIESFTFCCETVVRSNLSILL